MISCEICGNQLRQAVKICPFCGSEQEHVSQDDLVPAGRLHKTINLEQGKPFVETAIKRMLSEIQTAQTENVSILTVIHGYGSTGKGGAIRVECRKTLDYLVTTNKIQSFIFGENFNRKDGVVKSLLRRFPDLQQNKNLNRKNRGVTIVIL